MSKKIVMIVTNTDQIKKQGDTGLWLSEFVEPATELKEAGIDVVAASPKGGRTPIDPHSYSNELPRVWDGVMEPIHNTPKISEIDPTEFDGIFLCGGHGAMFDFPHNETLAHLLRHFMTEEKVIASVCHGAAGFIGVNDHNGETFVYGRNITAFTNEEEKQTEFEQDLPFLLQSKLEEEGANVEAGPAFEDHVVVDRNFITGQNHRSSLRTAQEVLHQLKNRSFSKRE